MINDTNHIKIPQWLDSYIFESLNANYARCNRDMLVIDWDKKMILNYLGTYFPRSYAESYSIFSRYFQNHILDYSTRSELNIFDFGCGTGGEIIGLLTSISEHIKSIRRVKVRALDGNTHALRLLERIVEELRTKIDFEIDVYITPIVIDDFYDLSLVESLLNHSFDFIISFKAICEFVSKQQFEIKNPYEHIIQVFRDKLNHNGIMCLADVTSYNDTAQDWLPKMMDKGIINNTMKVIMGNEGYNETFFISHSQQENDKSKIAWRIIKQ